MEIFVRLTIIALIMVAASNLPAMHKIHKSAWIEILEFESNYMTLKRENDIY